MLIALTIALVCSIAYNVYQHKVIARSEGALFDWSYELERDIQVCRLRTDGSLLSVWYDLNEDLADDSSVYFDNKGRSASAWVDLDYDGIMDLEYVLGMDGEILATYEDSDRDGRVEDYTRHTNDSLITYRDKNQDGHFAFTEIIERRSR